MAAGRARTLAPAGGPSSRVTPNAIRRMDDEPVTSRRYISLFAASSARRTWLANLAEQAFEHATIRRFAGLHAFRQPAGDTAMEIGVADLATPAEAANFVRLLEESPGVFGSVALIEFPEPRWLRAALNAGANAILPREPGIEEFRLGVAAAESGLVLLHPAVTKSLVTARTLAGSDFPTTAVHSEDEDVGQSRLEELTPREREVLLLMSAGLGNKQIAARLVISEHTAKFHISSILGKLSVSSRTEAVSQGIKRGLIPI
jgi:two-component system, NarL family, response regulator YdfI